MENKIIHRCEHRVNCVGCKLYNTVCMFQINPASHQLSVTASNTLAKCGFLCQVLAENPDYFHLAFCVGLFGLEMARPPASTKPLEVRASALFLSD